MVLGIHKENALWKRVIEEWHYCANWCSGKVNGLYVLGLWNHIRRRDALNFIIYDSDGSKICGMVEIYIKFGNGHFKWNPIFI